MTTPEEPHLTFDNALEAFASDVAQQQEVDRHVGEIQTHLDTLMDRHDVPTHHRITVSQEELIERKKQRAANLELALADKGYESRDDLIDGVNGVLFYETHTALTILNRSLMLNLEQRLTDTLPEDEKKKVMAMSFIDCKLPYKGAWMKFMGDAMPGESLDFSSEEDMEFVREAQVVVAQQAERIEKIKDVVMIFEQMWHPGEEDLSVIHHFSIVTQSLMSILNTKSLDDPQVQAKIDALARESGYEPDKLQLFATNLLPHLRS